MNATEFSKIKGENFDVSPLLAWVERHIKWLKNGHYELKITRKVKLRSLPQNRLMWMWFACISQETGQPIQDIHDYYCSKFLLHNIEWVDDKAMLVVGHTSSLDKEQFSEFLDRIQADAATQLGITLPTPDDMDWEEFEQHYKEYAR